MDIIEVLKNERPLDKLIIYMLYFGVSVSDIARKLDVSRDHIYKVRQRSKRQLVMYGLLDTSEKL